MSQNEDLFRKSIQCLNAQDATGFRALLAPDVEYLNPQGVYHGRDAAAGSFEPEWRAFSTGTHVIERLVETPTGVAAECSWKGTHDGPLATPMGEVPPTGREVTADYAIWVDVDAGLATRIRVYFDAMGYAMQLGLIPQPQTA
jgi:ketosteroid isomerase-like protein